MKITQIIVFHVDLPCAHPYWLSGGRLKFDVLDATLVKIETDAGITGWGGSRTPLHGPRATSRHQPLGLGIDTGPLGPPDQIQE